MLIGCNEWLALPGLGLEAVDARIDTGAHSSALHAEDITVRRKRGEDWLRFTCRVSPGPDAPAIVCEARAYDRREVRSSNGEAETRWFIRQKVRTAAISWTIEISLTDRGRMRHLMLLGRGALAGRFLVDPAASYLLGSAPIFPR